MLIARRPNDDDNNNIMDGVRKIYKSIHLKKI